MCGSGSAFIKYIREYTNTVDFWVPLQIERSKQLGLRVKKKKF
jgi:hypothetical protein